MLHADAVFDQQDYVATLYIRLSWRDHRLAFQHENISTLILDGKVSENAWVPDGFFVNLKKGSFHMVTMPNKLIRIKRDGTIFYSCRQVKCTLQYDKKWITLSPRSRKALEEIKKVEPSGYMWLTRK